MKKYLPLIILLTLSFEIYSQIKVSGGFLTVQPGSYIYETSSIGLTVNSGATLNQDGTTVLKGNLTNNGTIASGAGSEFEFSGTSAQTISGATTFNDLELNNTTGLTISSGNQDVSNSLILTNGVFTLGGNNLTVNTINVSTPNANRMINATGNGYLLKNFAIGNTSSFLFPVGDLTGTAEYSPVTLDFSANSTSRYIGFRLKDAAHPTQPSPPHYLSRYWESTAIPSTGSYSYSLTTTAVSADEVGNMAVVMPQNWNGSLWNEQVGSYTSPTATVSSASEITGGLGGNAHAIFETQFVEINISQSGSNILDGTGSYNFATACSGSTNPIVFTIENSGNISLTLNGSPLVQISGPDAGEFTITQPGAAFVSAFSTLNFTISFTPTSPGVKNATISIQNSDLNEDPYTFSISGTADIPTVGGTLSGGSTPICFASSTGTITLAGNVGSVLKWQKSLNGGAYSDIVNTANTYSETPSSAGTWTYRAVVQSGVCSQEYSSTVSIVVDPTTMGGTITGQGVVCVGQVVNLTLNGYTGTVLQWEESSAGVLGPFTAIPSTAGLISYSPPTNILGSKWYRVLVKSGICASAYSATIPFVTSVYCLHTWTGALHHDWNTAGNWIPQSVPTFGDPVLIPDVVNDPIIANYTGTCDSMYILSGATLGFAGPVSSSQLVIYGTIISMANNVVSGPGVFKFGNVTPVNATVTGGAYFKNDRVELSAGSTLKLLGTTDFALDKAIRVNNGATIYSSGSNGATAQLRFKDDPNGNFTALIDYNSGSALGTIVGEVSSERIVPCCNTGYRYLSSPVQNRLDQWIDDFSIYGADNWSSQVYTNPWPNVWIYNESLHGSNQANGWRSFTNTAANFGYATGYAAVIGSPLTIDVTGLLMVQTSPSANSDQTKAVTYTSSGTPLADGWNLLGNPFMAPLDWVDLYNANSSTLNPSLYRWMSSHGDVYGGGYSTYNALIGTGTPANASSRIAVQQGFLVKSTASGNLTMTRAMTKNNPAYTFMKETEENVLPKVRLAIVEEEEIIDECLAVMHPSASDQPGDPYDSEKKFNENTANVPEIYLTNSNAGEWKTAINTLPEFKLNTVIPIGLTNKGVFRVKVNELSNIPNNISVYFEDAKNKTRVKLNQNDMLTLSKSDGEESEGRYFLRFGRLDEATSAENSPSIGYTYVEDNLIKIRLFNAGTNPSVVNLFDITGKLIAKNNLGSNNGINVLNGIVLAPGVYVVTVKTDKGNFNDRVVIE